MSSITLAHSPDPDDVFMWWPITGMIEPPTSAQAQSIHPARMVSKPELDTGRFRFVPIAADIAALNRRAISHADLDITAISMNCYAHVARTYRLTSFGSSMGFGYGPKVVARVPEDQNPERERGVSSQTPARLASSVCYAEEFESGELVQKNRNADTEAAAALARRTRESLAAPNVLIAIPGRQTTAFLLLSMMLGDQAAHTRVLEMSFDHILDAARTGDRGVTHGLLIHQSQLTFAELGLTLIADVGDWWLKRTGLPLPLGGNAVRRDLDGRFGPGSTQEIAAILDRSLRHALANRARSLEYASRFAPEITRQQLERYIEMYVSDLTVDAGEQGEQAVGRLLAEGARLGLCPEAGRIDMLRPG